MESAGLLARVGAARRLPDAQDYMRWRVKYKRVHAHKPLAHFLDCGPVSWYGAGFPPQWRL